MPVPRKTSAVVSFKRIEELPRELPTLPSAVSERFPQMADWNARWSKWWFDFRTILQELDLSDSLKATNSELASFKASTTATLDALQQQLAEQAEEIDAIQIEVSGIDLSAILAAIAALQITVTSLSNQFSSLQITVNNQALTINNILTTISDNAIPVVILATPGLTPNFPLITGISGIFGNQRALNTADFAWWTWAGTTHQWVPG